MQSKREIMLQNGFELLENGCCYTDIDRIERAMEQYHSQFQSPAPSKDEGWNPSEPLKDAARAYAYSLQPYPNPNDAPYCTTGERWDDLNDAFIAGTQWAEQGKEATPVDGGLPWIKGNYPDKNGYYICWCTNPEEPGLIHFHKDTGWQNGFYNDRVIHYIKVTAPDSTPVDGGLRFGEWQTCPKCGGFGQLFTPSFNLNTTVVNYPQICDVCGGNKILAKPVMPNDLTDERSVATSDAHSDAAGQIEELKLKFAEHLQTRNKELDTSDGYAVEWTVKNLR